MMHLEIGGQRFIVAAGETIIGSAPGSGLLLSGPGVRPRHAIVQGGALGAVAIRAAAPDGEVLINGVRLGADPTPVLHGDKIQIGDQEILVVDSRRVGHTQLFDSGAFTDLLPSSPQKAATPTAPTGGRVVCLTDGREYTVAAEPLVFGRDAGCGVVLTGHEVSRRHAEIQASAEGYVLMDLSVNGTYVNGTRIGRRHLLGRADVIRIGHEEFRFYADVPAVAVPPRPSPPPSEAARAATGADQRLSDTLYGLPPSAGAGETTPVSPSPAPLASFLVRSGGLKGQRLPVKVPVVNIGRADYNDLVIADSSVSTTHAKLQRREQVWIMSDSGSTNGTFVDGERITGETLLLPGTTVRFGEVATLFEPVDEAKPAVRPAGTRLVEAVAPRSPAPPPAADQRFDAPARPRRPIRAAAPRPSGPPLWLWVTIALVGAALVFFFLRPS